MQKNKRRALLSLLSLIRTSGRTLASCNTNTPVAGEKGDKGDKGDTGGKGDKGEKGENGKDGEDLTDSSIGKDPLGKDIKSSKFYTDSSSVDDSLARLKKVNKEINGEGYVLLKNKDGYLPIKEKSKISVFGKNSATIATALSDTGFEVNPSLKAFYADNTKSGDGAKSRTNGSFNPTGETPQASYTDEVKESYSGYKDAAVVVFYRTGGEGSDLPRCSFADEKGQAGASMSYPTRQQIEENNWTPVGGQGRENNPFQHYLELDDNERALLTSLENSNEFQDVIVILSSSTARECDFLEDEEHYSKIKSAIWAQGQGASGVQAIGDILKGKISPSGRTTDIIEKDFRKDPSWQNYANNRVGNENGFDSARGDEYTTEDGLLFKDSWDQGYYGVEYEEGIYNGYKYYETRGYTDGEDWYEENVTYPFGYGLSYTDFSWELVSATPYDRKSLKENSIINLAIKVTNIGDYAGKDVVELYYSAPYIGGQIEKSHVKLGDYAKTGLLAPGESETVYLTLKARDRASYDFNDANKDRFKGYELDKGIYSLYISRDSHSWAERRTKEIHYTVDSTIQYSKDEASGTEIENQFDYRSDEREGHTMSRTDFEGTFPTRPLWYDVTNDTTIDPLWLAEYRATHDGNEYSANDTSVTPVYLKKGKARLVKSDTWLENLTLPLKDKTASKNASNFEIDNSYDEDNALYGGGKAPWYSSTAPSFRDEKDQYTAENKAPIQLKDLRNTSIEDPKWDAFISQYTLKQAIGQIITPFNFVADESLGLPVSAHADGNTGLRKVFDLIAYLQDGDRIESEKLTNDLNPTLLGATWNKDLAYRWGKANGDLALWYHIGGWYGPSCNTHRSHFSGRNPQYFSEDGVLSGKRVSGVTRGANNKGLVTFLKHFALNDQETHRDVTGISTWVNEQALRENYLKPYELAVKEGETLGRRTSFNRVGFEWAGASYRLLTTVARDEWNFKGIYITDAAGTSQAGNYRSADRRLRAGEDRSLDGVAGGYNALTDNGTPAALTGLTHTASSSTPTHLNAIYQAAKRIAYVESRSNAMCNGRDIEKRGYNQSASDIKTRFGQIQNEADIVKFDVKKGTKTTFSVNGNLQDTKYVLYSGDLLGLKLDPYTGTISGTVSDQVAPGKYRICIGAARKNIKQGEEWTSSDVNYFYLNVLEA